MESDSKHLYWRVRGHIPECTFTSTRTFIAAEDSNEGFYVHGNINGIPLATELVVWQPYRPAMESTQSHIHWVPGGLSQG